MEDCLWGTWGKCVGRVLLARETGDGKCSHDVADAELCLSDGRSDLRGVLELPRERIEKVPMRCNLEECGDI